VQWRDSRTCLAGLCGVGVLRALLPDDVTGESYELWDTEARFVLLRDVVPCWDDRKPQDHRRA